MAAEESPEKFIVDVKNPDDLMVVTKTETVQKVIERRDNYYRYDQD